MWTFPQFKQSDVNSFQNEIIFPDPKYYMIGITLIQTDNDPKENADPVGDELMKPTPS